MTFSDGSWSENDGKLVGYTSAKFSDNKYFAAIGDLSTKTLQSNYITLTSTATGTVTLTGTLYSNRLYVVNTADVSEYQNPTVSNNSCTFNVEAGKSYYLLQTANNSSTSGYRYGFGSFTFAASTITGTIASSGWSSLASSFALNFSGAENATGYVVSDISGTTVTLTSVNQMPANSGVILKGTANTAYSIPVIASASFGGTNKLKAAVTATDIAANAAYILQSGAFHLVTAASTVPAGKAYLSASDVSNGAPSLSFAFDDEGGTTSINNVNTKGLLDGEFYNLQGQRVDKPAKGLYIVNGKKVIIK